MTTARGALARISEEVLSWPGVRAEAGDFGSTAFLVGRREIGHLHGDRAAHFAFPASVGQRLRAEGRVDAHPFVRDSAGMAARGIRGEADIADVLTMLRLNYDRVVARHGIPG